MTEQEKQELSKAVADKYGIDSHRFSSGGDVVFNNAFWLHNDSARCFDLMVEQGLIVELLDNYVFVQTGFNNLMEYFYNHPTKQEATRIAVLKALLVKE